MSAAVAGEAGPTNELAVLGYHEELKRNRSWLTILSQSLVISSVRIEDEVNVHPDMPDRKIAWWRPPTFT